MNAKSPTMMNVHQAKTQLFRTGTWPIREPVTSTSA